MQIGEIFGFGVGNNAADVQLSRQTKRCPFAGDQCTKASKTDPLAICSLTNGAVAVALCPKRFLERGLALSKAAEIAFGTSSQFEVFPEVRVLEIAGRGSDKSRKIGKIDFVLGEVTEGKVTDFCAVEFQGVYFSGGEMRSAFKLFIEDGVVPTQDRRPDFRSSAQKRLMPQLDLKIPIFRRWGKKFFVVVDSLFFGSLPPFRTTQPENSEITWLVCTLQRSGDDYSMQAPRAVYSDWDDVKMSLREGVAPTPNDILAELQAKLDRRQRQRQ